MVQANPKILLDLVEDFFNPEQQHTDLIRLIAIEALAGAKGLEQNFRLLKLLRNALTDDDEDVRHAASLTFTSLLKISSSESIASALTTLHQEMRKNYKSEYQEWLVKLTSVTTLPKEDSGILFLKEEENMFVNPHWELSPLSLPF